MDDAEWEWGAHRTQIHRIKADAKKSHAETLSTKNWIEEVIMENNCIFSRKWEAMHDWINHHPEEHLLLKNQVVNLESLLGLQQTTCHWTLFLLVFLSIFNPTPLHIPYSTFLPYAYRNYVSSLMPSCSQTNDKNTVQLVQLSPNNSSTGLLTFRNSPVEVPPHPDPALEPPPLQPNAPTIQSSGLPGHRA